MGIDEASRVARRWRKEGRKVFAWDLVEGVEIAVVDEGEKSRPHRPRVRLRPNGVSVASSS